MADVSILHNTFHLPKIARNIPQQFPTYVNYLNIPETFMDIGNQLYNIYH